MIETVGVQLCREAYASFCDNTTRVSLCDRIAEATLALAFLSSLL